MQHLFIFIYVFVILVGAVSIAIATLIHARTRNRMLAEYILYISNLLLFIFFYLLLLLYLSLNVPDVNFYLLLATVALSLLSCFLLMYTIPRFTHALVWEKPPAKRNTYAGIAATVALVLMICSFRVSLSEKALSQERNVWMYASLALFYISIIYAIALQVVSLKRLVGEHRKILRGITFLNVFFFPGTILDLFLYNRFRVFVFSPIFYSAFCILFTRYIVGQYFVRLRSLSSGIDEAAIDSALEGAGISLREREIILLLSKGLGNREIAEKLFISLHTVKTHNRNIFEKLGVRSRFELLVRLREGAGEHLTPHQQPKA